MIRRPSSSATGIGLFDYFCYGLLRMFKGHSIQIFLWTRSFTAPLFGHQTSSQSLMLKPTIGCIKSSCRALTSTSPTYKRSFGLVEHKERPVPAADPYEDFSDDNGLYPETVSSAGDVDNVELVEEEAENGATNADGVLSWKVEHSNGGDHKLKGSIRCHNL